MSYHIQRFNELYLTNALRNAHIAQDCLKPCLLDTLPLGHPASWTPLGHPASWTPCLLTPFPKRLWLPRTWERRWQIEQVNIQMSLLHFYLTWLNALKSLSSIRVKVRRLSNTKTPFHVSRGYEPTSHRDWSQQRFLQNPDKHCTDF